MVALDKVVRLTRAPSAAALFDAFGFFHVPLWGTAEFPADAVIGKTTAKVRIRVECDRCHKVRTALLSKLTSPETLCRGCRRSVSGAEKSSRRIGHTFHHLTVLALVGQNPPVYQCQCRCGALCEVAGDKLDRREKPTKSCGCLSRSEEHRAQIRRKKTKKPALAPGDTFGQLRVLAVRVSRPEESTRRESLAECLCACGTHICVPVYKLHSGQSSCRCSWSRTGADHPSWKADKTTEERAELLAGREGTEYRAFVRATFVRDAFSCCVCGANRNLQIHHLLGWTRFPERRMDLTNVATVCQKCHKGRGIGFHSLYGHVDFSPEDFYCFQQERTCQLLKA